jgi:hypothetical protein
VHLIGAKTGEQIAAILAALDRYFSEGGHRLCPATIRSAEIGKIVPHRDCIGNNFVVFVVCFGSTRRPLRIVAVNCLFTEGGLMPFLPPKVATAAVL